jgi:hypothetical protein
MRYRRRYRWLAYSLVTQACSNDSTPKRDSATSFHALASPAAVSWDSSFATTGGLSWWTCTSTRGPADSSAADLVM